MMQKSVNRIRQALQQQIRYALKSVNCEDYCSKGNEYHYKRIQQQQRERLTNASRVYCIDRSAIDVALQMAKRKQKVLTMLTPLSYEAVTIKNNKQRTNQAVFDERQQRFEQYLADSSLNLAKNNESIPKDVESIPKDVSEIALHILNNYRFVVKACSLDIHPFQSYKKLCGYIMAKQDRKITKHFNQTSFSNTILSQNISLAAFMNEVRQRYIVTDYYKLKLLPRRNPKEIIDEQTKQSYLQRWKQAVNFSLIETTAKESFEESTKIKWAIENRLGTVVTQEEIIRNKFRYDYYATWI